MRRPLGVVLAILLLLAAGVVLAPAAWLDRLLALRTQGELRLADATGWWWRGRGTLVGADGAARVPIAWRVALLPLFDRALEVRLDGDRDGIAAGSLRLAAGSIELHGVRLRAPAALVAAFFPASRPLAWGGDVALSAPSFAWRDRAVTGSFDATWQRARVVVGVIALDLGTVSMAAAPAGDAIAGRVSNAGGELGIDGTIANRGGAFDVALTLRPTDATPAAVRQMLPLLGTPDGSGGVRLAWLGRR